MAEGMGRRHTRKRKKRKKRNGNVTEPNSITQSKWNRNTSRAFTLASIYLPIGEQWTQVARRTENDLPQEVLGSVYWTEGVGYQTQVVLEDGTTKAAEVEFINDVWHLLDLHDGKYRTNSSGRFRKGLVEVGDWPDSHPNNPKNKDITIDVAPSFGDYLTKGIEMATEQTAEPSAQINMGGGPVLKGKKKETDQEDAGNGGLKGKTPNIFDGDRAKSKAFLSNTKIYFRINRKKTEIKNCYTRVLLTLSFIKGPNVVNWVDTQLDQVEDDLKYQCGDNEFDETLWDDFERRFKCTFVSSTAKEDAYIKMQKLKMKNDQLDEYIVEHGTLISELDWDADSKMSCHSFREGLPDPLARKVIDMEGIPDSLTQWVQYAQKNHSRWAMT